MSDRRTVTIEIANLTEAQAVAIEDMLATWAMLGSQGSSRWTAFFADGDGNFRPKVTVNGRKAQQTDLVLPSEKWRNAEYRMDFDTIAWRLRKPAGETNSSAEPSP
jgi:hypothetical protein